MRFRYFKLGSALGGILQYTRIMLLRQRLAFSVGHVLNDLTAAVWFTYLVAYFQKVICMGADWAGYVMLFGQIADAVSTTFIGIESDRTHRSGLFNYGRRKTWHLFGTFCVIVSFPFIFMPCIGCSPGTSDWALFTYYAPFVAIFQFGWAAIQIEHLALIPELASDSEDLRVVLASRRNDFTVASTIAVYLLTWLLFGTKSSSDAGPSLLPTDASRFRLLSLILLGIGIIFSVIFHVFVKENTQDPHVEIINEGEELTDNRRQSFDRLAWFTKPLFYSLAVLYTAVRIILNVSQTVMPLYILEAMHLQKADIATVPLAMYLAGFASSLATPYLHRCMGRRRVVLLGSLCVIGGCIWIFFLTNSSTAAYYVYGVAIIVGAGQQIIYIASVTLTSDTIATHAEGKNTAAFVWGVLSFFDKIANGVAIMLIQKEHPSDHPPYYYRWMMSFVPGGGALVAILAVAAMSVIMARNNRSEDRHRLIGSSSNDASASDLNVPNQIEVHNSAEHVSA